MTDLFWTIYRVTVAGLFGLLAGSFLNVCIYRLPRGETIVHGHSYCPHCRHPLRGPDLIPVLSYLLLGRRCRYCRQPIAARYAKVEAVTGIGSALLVWLWGAGPLSPARHSRAAWLAAVPDTFFNAVAVCCILATFSALLVWSMILYDRQEPPRGLYLFIALPLLARLFWQPQRWLAQLLAAGLAVLVCWLHLQLLRQSARPGGLAGHLLAGFSLLGFAAGMPAFLPVPLACVVIYAWCRRKQPDQPAATFCSLAPPVAVLAAFLAMLAL